MEYFNKKQLSAKTGISHHQLKNMKIIPAMTVGKRCLYSADQIETIKKEMDISAKKKCKLLTFSQVSHRLGMKPHRNSVNPYIYGFGESIDGKMYYTFRELKIAKQRKKEALKNAPKHMRGHGMRKFDSKTIKRILSDRDMGLRIIDLQMKYATSYVTITRILYGKY